MGTRKVARPVGRRRRSSRTTPAWVLILEFAGALIVLGFLAVGPGPLDAFARLIQQAPAARVRVARPPTPRAPDAEPAGSKTVPRVKSARQIEPARKVDAASAESARASATSGPPPRVRPRPAPTATPAPAAEESTLTPQKYFEKLMREGHELYSTGWYGPAIGRFRQAAAVMPASASAQLWMGRAAWKAGRLAEARQALERAVELAPTSEAAREARALLERLN